MNFREAVAISTSSLWAHKLRGALTLLGVVIGVAAVIAVVSLVNGANKYVATKVFRLGTDVFGLAKQPSIVTNVDDWLAFQKRKKLTYDDFLEEHRAPVVMLGYDTANTLFPEGADKALGQEVTIDGQLFTVIGTMLKRRQGISGGANPEDNIAFMPVTTLRKLYPNHKDYVIFAKASDPSEVSQAVEEIRDLLRRKRRLTSDKPDDFALFTSDYFLELWSKISSMIFMLTFAIASVGLLVGGIGVMNIMLVSVTERTREIGVRKAVGAKRSNILVQFLIEAVTLCAVIGIVFGGGLTLLMKYAVRMPANLSAFWVVTALVLCAAIGIGIGFGIYPAWKAARLDPVEALRYE